MIRVSHRAYGINYKCLLTVNMIDVVDAHVLVAGLLPTEWKLVANAVGKCLGFGKSEN